MDQHLVDAVILQQRDKGENGQGIASQTEIIPEERKRSSLNQSLTGRLAFLRDRNDAEIASLVRRKSSSVHTEREDVCRRSAVSPIKAAYSGMSNLVF